MGLPALKTEMLECRERIERRALQEKKINHLTTAVKLPSQDMLPSLFQKKFRMNRMCWLTVSHAAQAMCLPALRALLLSRRAAEPVQSRLWLWLPAERQRATMAVLERWEWFRCREHWASRVRVGKRTVR